MDKKPQSLRTGNGATASLTAAGDRPGSRLWLLFAAITTIFWGVWGALIEIPEKAGFPATLGYVVWSLTMVPSAVVALGLAGWKLERSLRAIALGLTVGLLGASGQVILFQALRLGPAYLIFPIVSLYPIVTVLLSIWLLREKASRRAWAGVMLSFPAVVMLSYQPPQGSAGEHHLTWLLLAFAVFMMWGVQAYVMKFSTNEMKPESVFFYMMAGGLLIAPAALVMTDFSANINWGFRGMGSAALIQVLNAVGALCLVFALRFGKAIIVVPMTALAPVLTIIISLSIYQVVPHPVVVAGMVAASIAIFLMAE